MSQVNVPMAFRNMASNLKNASPNTGEGFLGPWPAEGEHDNIINDISFNEKATYFAGKDKIPAVGIQFHYTLVGAPGQPASPGTEDKPFTWRGKPMTFPSVGYSDEDKSYISAKIDRDRFAGFFSVIMGRMFNPDAFADELTALLTKIKGDTPVVARIKCEYRNWTSKPKNPGEAPKTGVDKCDWCRELLQGS